MTVRFVIAYLVTCWRTTIVCLFFWRMYMHVLLTIRRIRKTTIATRILAWEWFVTYKIMSKMKIIFNSDHVLSNYVLHQICSKNVSFQLISPDLSWFFVLVFVWFRIEIVHFDQVHIHRIYKSRFRILSKIPQNRNADTDIFRIIDKRHKKHTEKSVLKDIIIFSVDRNTPSSLYLLTRIWNYTDTYLSVYQYGFACESSNSLISQKASRTQGKGKETVSLQCVHGYDWLTCTLLWTVRDFDCSSASNKHIRCCPVVWCAHHWCDEQCLAWSWIACCMASILGMVIGQSTCRSKSDWSVGVDT